jgi:hypothetical protein
MYSSLKGPPQLKHVASGSIGGKTGLKRCVRRLQQLKRWYSHYVIRKSRITAIILPILAGVDPELLESAFHDIPHQKLFIQNGTTDTANTGSHAPNNRIHTPVVIKDTH